MENSLIPFIVMEIRTVDLPKTDVENPELEILVEAMGDINFAQFMID